MKKIILKIAVFSSVFFIPSFCFCQTPLTSCGIITSSGNYLLQNNVSSPDTCFEIRANDVFLDLGGHTVTFADRPNNLVIPNFGFESGSGSNASNWNQSSAPSAIRTNEYPSIRDQWVREEVGNYVMKFNSPSGAQYIYSEELTTADVEPGTIHVLSAIIHRHYSDHSYVRAWMIDKNGTPFCTNNYGSTGTSWHYAQTSDRSEFWAAYDCGFVATADQYPLRVRIGVTQALGSFRSAYFDAIEVKPANDYKFESYNGGVSRMVGIRTSDEGTARNNIRITNGNIVQGSGKAYYTRATYLRGSDIEVDNINVVIYGPDSSGIFLTYSPGFHVHHNSITLNGKRTHYSHQGWVGAIETNAGNGSSGNYLRIHDNVIHRAPASGIRVATDYVDIYNNTINLEVSAIHCYAIFPRGDNYRIYNNVIQNNYGSGIFLEGVKNTQVYGNYVEVSDVPHEDYEWTGKAIWSRYGNGNHDIHDNIFIGYSGSDHPIQHMPYAISVVRLGCSNEDYGPIYFRNNIVEAYTSKTSQNYNDSPPTYAVALDVNMDGDPGCTKYFENNTFKSNDKIVLFGGDYAAGRRARLKDNKFVKIDTAQYPATTSFRTVYFGGNYASGNEITDSPGENGADVHDIGFLPRPRAVELAIKWKLVVMVRGANGQCINGASVNITNQSQGSVNGTTSNGGSFYQILLDQFISGTASSPNIFTVEPYTVTAGYGGASANTTVTMDNRKIVYLTLSGVNGTVACVEPSWNPGADESSAPVRTNGQPSGILPVGTTQTTISLNTNEPATCKYSTSAGVNYDSMPHTFSNTGGTSHSSLITGLMNGQSYAYYVRCRDGEGNTNTYDYLISFSVGVPDTQAPNRFNGQPSGLLAAGTVQTSISLQTDENAVCRYSQTPAITYGSMSNTFSNTGGMNHSTIVTGLQNGGSYSYYVKCADLQGNENMEDFIISFGVSDGPDITAPQIIDWGPRDPLPKGTVETNIRVDTSETAVCRYSQEEGDQFEEMTKGFTSRNGLTHSARVSGLRDDSSYTFFVRCRDYAGNVNELDFNLTIHVSSEVINPQIDGPLVRATGGCSASYGNKLKMEPIMLLILTASIIILYRRKLSIGR